MKRILTLFCALFAFAAWSMPSKIDFSYAFATPHRVTAGRPDAGDKTLLDLQPGSLKMSWTYDNLAMPNYPPLTFKTPTTQWRIQITPQVDGKSFDDSRWTRPDGFLPGVVNRYETNRTAICLEVLGGMTAALMRIDLVNDDTQPHQFALRCDAGWPSENPAWVDASQHVGDNLQAGWKDRADRVLLLAVGADTYSLQTNGLPPGANTLLPVWNLKPGEKRTGWIVRPYRAYADELPALRTRDWTGEQAQGKQEWRKLLDSASQLTIPDSGAVNAYRACLADLFIMREPLADGRIIGVPGTEGYRAGNSAEPLIICVALDQNGYHKESAAASSVSFDMQSADGCWDDRAGWMHTMWCGAGFKAWAAMEHYRLTDNDRSFLKKIYPRMLASSRWQERQRARSRKTADKGEKPLTYGLMPRGFGDCGLKNDDDMYGVFLPHNIWAVYADRCSLEAAEILGKKRDADELTKIYETARTDLLAALDCGAITGPNGRWIPGVPGKTSGSCWGVLNALSPCGLLPPDHELVTGTLRKIEANVSKGGQPIHTGWMADGAWVAITLDNIAEAHLARGEGDVAAMYLTSTLNHGTPLYTWCEERGLEPGAKKTSGDRQHLWTPVAVVRAMRDMMVLENGDGLELALGTDRDWLGFGEPVGIANACTHFGRVSYTMRYDANAACVTGEVSFAKKSAARAILHIRLPHSLKVTSVDPDSRAEVLPDGSGLRWTQPYGTFHFQAAVGN